MVAFRRIEDIVAWQKTRELTRSIYSHTANTAFSKDFDLTRQIRRASISIMANIAEGFGRNSDKEFANFLNMAHGSAYEVQSHLYITLDLNYIDRATFDTLYNASVEIARILYGLRNSLL